MATAAPCCGPSWKNVNIFLRLRTQKHTTEKALWTKKKKKDHMALVKWVSRQQPLAADRRLHDAFPLLSDQSVSAAIMRLDTRISQRWKRSLFARNICLLVSCQDDLWCHSPKESDYHHSVRTPACHVITSARSFVAGHVYEFMINWQRDAFFFSVSVHYMCHSLSTWTYGLKGMEPAHRSVRRDQRPGSKCQRGLTGTLDFHGVSLQMWRRTLPSVPDAHW